MQFATLTFSAIGAITGTASLVIMYKTKKALDAAGESLKAEVDNVKATTNTTLSNLRTALEGVEL